MARALRLASTTFDGLEREPSIYIQGTALCFEMADGHDPETTLATMRTLVRMMEEKVAARAAHRRVHGRQRPDGRSSDPSTRIPTCSTSAS